MHCNRNVFSDRTVGSVLVVGPKPILQLYESICKAHEPMRVQTLRPQLAVERLNKAVLRCLSRPREVRGDVVCVGPEVEIAATGAADAFTRDHSECRDP